LIELMQEVNYGVIEQLEVRRGEPVLQPKPTILRDIALGKDNGPHPAREKDNFELKRPVEELFEVFDRERDIRIDRLIIQAGLPLRLRVRGSVQVKVA
jgi:hypothetical protein